MTSRPSSRSTKVSSMTTPVAASAAPIMASPASIWSSEASSPSAVTSSTSSITSSPSSWESSSTTSCSSDCYWFWFFFSANHQLFKSFFLELESLERVSSQKHFITFMVLWSICWGNDHLSDFNVWESINFPQCTFICFSIFGFNHLRGLTWLTILDCLAAFKIYIGNWK